MTTGRGKQHKATLAEQLAAGTQKHLSAGTPILIGGSTFTPAQMATQLETLAALRDAVDAARAALAGRLADERSKGPALGALQQAFVGYVQIAFAGQPEILADFGLAPKKVRTPLTAEQTALAKAKRKATREARGTIGKKKKLAIKGNVTGITMIPITEPAPAH